MYLLCYATAGVNAPKFTDFLTPLKSDDKYYIWDLSLCSILFVYILAEYSHKGLHNVEETAVLHFECMVLIARESVKLQYE